MSMQDKFNCRACRFSLREPHRNQFTAYFRAGYYTCINAASFFIRRIIKNRKYEGDVVYRTETKKYLYSRAFIQRSLKEQGFGSYDFYLSKLTFPFTKMFLYPLALKFPGLRPHFESVIKIAYKIDSYILEKIVFKDLLQEVSFSVRKS